MSDNQHESPFQIKKKSKFLSEFHYSAPSVNYRYNTLVKI